MQKSYSLPIIHWGTGSYGPLLFGCVDRYVLFHNMNQFSSRGSTLADNQTDASQIHSSSGGGSFRERERKSMWGVFFPVLNKHSCFHAEGHFSDEWSGRYPAISKNNKPATEAVLLTLKWLSLMWRCLGTSILGLLLLLKRSTYFVLHHICRTGDDYRYFSVLRWPKQKALSTCRVSDVQYLSRWQFHQRQIYLFIFSCSVGLIKIKAQRAKSVRSFP